MRTSRAPRRRTGSAAHGTRRRQPYRLGRESRTRERRPAVVDVRATGGRTASCPSSGSCAGVARYRIVDPSCSSMRVRCERGPRGEVNDVVTTSTVQPLSTSPAASSRMTGIGPPNAVAGQNAGAAKRTCNGLSGSVTRLDVSLGACRRRNTPRQRLLVLNQYYWPGVEATANLLTELCEALASTYDIEVITGVVHEHEDEPRSLDRNGVSDQAGQVDCVRPHRARWRAPRITSRISARRLLSGLAAQTAGSRPLHDRPADGRRRRPRRVPPLRRAARRRLPGRVPRDRRQAPPTHESRRGRRVAGDRRVVPSPGRSHRLDRRDDEPQARRQGRTSGSDRRDPELGRSGRDHTARRATTPGPRPTGSRAGSSSCTRATSVTRRTSRRSSARRCLLRDLDRLEIVIIGFGARHAALVELARASGASNVRFLPYQPREVLSDSLSAADIHYLGLVRGLAGYVVPSRLNGILSAGRPVIVAADAESEPAQVVESAGCGIAVPPGDPDALAAAIRSAYAGEIDLATMGANGRELDRPEQGEGCRDRELPRAPRGASRRRGHEPGMIARYGRAAVAILAVLVVDRRLEHAAVPAGPRLRRGRPHRLRRVDPPRPRVPRRRRRVLHPAGLLRRHRRRDLARRADRARRAAAADPARQCGAARGDSRAPARAGPARLPEPPPPPRRGARPLRVRGAGATIGRDGAPRADVALLHDPRARARRAHDRAESLDGAVGDRARCRPRRGPARARLLALDVRGRRARARRRRGGAERRAAACPGRARS